MSLEHENQALRAIAQAACNLSVAYRRKQAFASAWVQCAQWTGRLSDQSWEKMMEANDDLASAAALLDNALEGIRIDRAA